MEKGQVSPFKWALWGWELLRVWIIHAVCKSALGVCIFLPSENHGITARHKHSQSAYMDVCIFNYFVQGFFLWETKVIMLRWLNFKPTSPKFRFSCLKTHLVSPGASTGCLRNMAGKKEVLHRHRLINGNHAQCNRNAARISVSSKSQKRRVFLHLDW